MIKSVIFDIDDTIYSYKKGNALAMKALYQYTADHFGFTEEETASKLKEAQKMVRRYLGADTAVTHNRLIRFQNFAEMNNIPIFPHAENMAEIYWKTLITSAEPSPGLIDFLTALTDRGISVGIGTNMTAHMQFLKLRQTGVSQFVSFMVTSEELPLEKPDPAFFTRCIEKSGCAPSEIAFIGDSLKNDAQPAAAAGMKGIWYAAGKDESEIASAENITAAITDFATAIQIIEKL